MILSEKLGKNFKIQKNTILKEDFSLAEGLITSDIETQIEEFIQWRKKF